MSALDAILAPEGLSVVFQPILELLEAGPIVTAVEGLVRGPSGSNLRSPEVLFEYVRRKREEVRVDRACVAAVLRAHESLPGGPALSLNVHAATLDRDPEFPDFLGEQARRGAVPLTKLTIEIVEHAPTCSTGGFSRALARLRHDAVRIALDDVGTGQSNFRMMLDCRPDYFKIDRSLVSGCHLDFRQQALIESIARLARSFGGRAVAEGVETARELDAVRTAGVDLIQGHFFSRALPAAELLASGWLAPSRES